jgi:CrcB protein
LDLLRSGAVGRALLNVLASVVLCVLAVFLGHVLASGLNGGAKAVALVVLEEEA